MFANNPIIPAAADSLSRTEIKAAFRRNRGAAIQLARDLGVNRARISDWFGKRYQNVDASVDRAIRQRAADLINAERRAASSGQGGL